MKTVSCIKSVQSFPKDCVEIGVIVSAYGLNGLIKVAAYSDIRANNSAILSAKNWWLKRNTDYRISKMVHARVHGNMIVANLDGLRYREIAESMRGFHVFVCRADFPIPAEDEFYLVDLIGLNVINKQSTALGTVTDIIDNGAHFILKTECFSTEKTESRSKKNCLIPFVSLYLKKIDWSTRHIIVDWKTDY